MAGSQQRPSEDEPAQVGALHEPWQRRVRDLETTLQRQLVGQELAADAVLAAVRTAAAGLKPTGAPIAAFMFVGPRGVGRSHLSRLVARALFGTDGLVRIDLSAYGDETGAARLFGPRPATHDPDVEGHLTARVREHQGCVVQLDEIEQASDAVLDLLQQVMRTGQFHAANGRVTEFRDTLMIATSNTIGRSLSERSRRVGFGVPDEEFGMTWDEARTVVMDDIRSHFHPDFVDAIGEIVVFHRLNRDEAAAVLELLLARARASLAVRDVTLALSDDAVHELIDTVWEPATGAHGLERAIRRHVEDPLSSLLLDSALQPGATVVVSRVDGDDAALRLEIVNP